jgi:hypothetical protein
LKVTPHFGGKCRFHLQGRKISQHEAGSKQIPENGEVFFRNVGWLSMDCTELYPRRQNLINTVVRTSDLTQGIVYLSARLSASQEELSSV